MKSKVGIIVNPESGRDIRRLVFQALIFSNEEKTNIVARAILALDSLGVDEILLLPDLHGIGAKSRDRINRKLGSDVNFIELNPEGNSEDTLRATRMMREEAISCLITIGGDGTNRLVAKECESVPIVPISTGTNNVFPYMVEGTVAGLAAGTIAMGFVTKEEVSMKTKRCEVIVQGKIDEIALIDATVTTDQFTGSGAIWDVSQVREIVATQGSPTNIGMSSVAGSIVPISQRDDKGIYVELGEGGRTVMSAIAPGMFVEIHVKSCRMLRMNEIIEVKKLPCVIALDGERLIETNEGGEISLRVTRKGPLRVDIQVALMKAAERGFFEKKSHVRSAKSNEEDKTES